MGLEEYIAVGNVTKCKTYKNLLVSDLRISLYPSTDKKNWCSGNFLKFANFCLYSESFSVNETVVEFLKYRV